MPHFRASIFSAVRHIRPVSTTSSPTANMSASRPPHYILSFYVPTADTSKVMSEVCKSGAGSYPGGLYTEAYWITSGTGQFRPMTGANPAIGKVGDIEKVEENKVEVLCVGEDCMQKAIKELLKAHPYEEVPYYVVKSEV